MVSSPSFQAPRGSSCSSVWTGHSCSRVRDAGSCATWPCTLCRWMCGTANPSCLSAPQPWGSRYSKTGLLASPHMVRRHTLTGSCPCFFLPHMTPYVSLYLAWETDWHSGYPIHTTFDQAHPIHHKVLYFWPDSANLF